MHHYLDLYNVNRRLLLETLSGFQYPQFQIFLSLVLIQKNAKKDKNINHVFYKVSIF